LKPVIDGAISKDPLKPPYRQPSKGKKGRRLPIQFMSEPSRRLAKTNRKVPSLHAAWDKRQIETKACFQLW